MMGHGRGDGMMGMMGAGCPMMGMMGAMGTPSLSRITAPHQDQVIVNALIDTFCIHARQLTDFFNNRQGVRATKCLGRD